LPQIQWGASARQGRNANKPEEDGQESAQVIKTLGNGRLEALDFAGVKRLRHIRGKPREKVWINTSDIILYKAEAGRSLKTHGELPPHARFNERDTFGPGDDDKIGSDDLGDDDDDTDDI
uniref:S1-like domain-containing protein n=1 Tax=Anolis carolinensis TaxID=28377 RepID=A0A803T869_ANOCA